MAEVGRKYPVVSMAKYLVREAMSERVMTLSQGQSLPLARELMSLARVRHLPVVDAHGALVGLVTHRDLLEASVSSLTNLSNDDRDELQLRVPVSRIMRTDCDTITPDASVLAAAQRMRERGVGCLPVVQRGQLVGIITEADVMGACVDQLAVEPSVPSLRSVMTPAPQVIEASQPVSVALSLMRARGVHHLPVMIADELFGILCAREAAVAEAAHSHPESLLVGQLVQTPAFVVNADARLEEVALDLANQPLSYALVMEHGRVLGIVTNTDLCRVLGKALRELRRWSQPPSAL